MIARRKSIIRILVLALSVTVALTAVVTEPVYATAKPAKVTGLKVSARTATTITVKWNKAKRARKYQIAYKISGGSWKYSTVKYTVRTRKISKLKNYRKYYVKVRALRGTRKGTWSSTISTYTEPKTFKWPELPTISDVSVKTGYGSITVRWEKKDADDVIITKVPIEKAEEDESEEAALSEDAEPITSENPATEEKLTSEETVAPVEQISEEKSVEENVQNDPTEPGQEEGVTEIPSEEQEYEIVETPVYVNNDKCVFNVYRSTDNKTWTLVGKELANTRRSYVCRKCDAGKTYYFKVVAVDNTTYKTFTHKGEYSSVINGAAHLPEGLVIKKNFTTRNGAYKEATPLSVKGLMVHSVGEPVESAQTWVTRFNKAGYDRAAVHGFVDGTTGVVNWTMPWDWKSWHAGSPANGMYIGVEMCESKYIKYTSGTKFTIKAGYKDEAVKSAKITYENTVKLFAYLCDYYGIDPLGTFKTTNSKKKTVSVNRIISHNEWRTKGFAGHHDPEHYWKGLGLPYTMSGFRKDVDEMLKTP